jgi:RNA polymerase sigma-70 factor (ECF subfamily)
MSDKANQRAFERDLVSLTPELFRFARSLVGDPCVADDLVQETVARALQHRERFAMGTSLRAWTFTILRNFHYAQWHKQKRYTEWEPWLDETLEAAGGQEASAALAATYDLMCALPDCQRDALMLVAVGGCTYEEAAALEKCPVGTMKSRVSRARTALLAAPEAPPREQRANSFTAMLDLANRLQSALDSDCTACAPAMMQADLRAAAAMH